MLKNKRSAKQRYISVKANELIAKGHVLALSKDIRAIQTYAIEKSQRIKKYKGHLYDQSNILQASRYIQNVKGMQVERLASRGGTDIVRIRIKGHPIKSRVRKSYDLNFESYKTKDSTPASKREIENLTAEEIGSVESINYFASLILRDANHMIATIRNLHEYTDSVSDWAKNFKRNNIN